VLQRLLRAHRRRRAPALPPFQGGALGYFGYDLAHHLEVLPRRAVDDVGLPDLHVGLYPWVLAHDHISDRTWLIVNALDADLAAAERLLRELRGVIASVRSDVAEPDHSLRRRIVAPNFTREGYLQAIATAKDYIAAGDIYEICLSQRFTMEIAEHPWQLYRRLRSISPVPYGAYLGLPEAAVVSASPEMFLRFQNGAVETRPIKGTRPRGSTPELDRRLAAELRASEKEQAENLMIVDLLRNDLGRVCRIGSVKVPELFAIESYSTVHQMVSTIQGELRPELDAIDLLRACFPGGSVTGCPKRRAMAIIDELEPTQRGIYCGAIGFIGFDGSMDTSIVIRTMVVKDRRAYLQVGGAIVADSDPAAEYQETLDKAQAALLAISGSRFGSEILARS
jgi:para-aminobenzoate synthetase component 1